MSWANITNIVSFEAFMAGDVSGRVLLDCDAA
jgi:hypothetical protein